VARFAVVQVYKIHKCTLGKIKCHDEISHITENTGYILLQAGLPETTHLVHKANHAVKPTSLRLSKKGNKFQPIKVNY